MTTDEIRELLLSGERVTLEAKLAGNHGGS